MRWVKMTPHSLLIEHGERQVNIQGDVILQPRGYVAFTSSLDTWSAPFSDEEISEDTKASLKEFVSAELEKRGMSLIWDDTRFDPNLIDQIKSNMSNPVRLSAQSRRVQHDIYLDERHMSVYIDIAEILSPTIPGLDGNKYTVHLKKHWDDGSLLSPEQIAALTIPPRRFTPSPNPSLVELVFEK